MSQRHISIISRQDYYNQTAIISQLNYLLKKKFWIFIERRILFHSIQNNKIFHNAFYLKAMQPVISMIQYFTWVQLWIRNKSGANAQGYINDNDSILSSSMSYYYDQSMNNWRHCWLICYQSDHKVTIRLSVTAWAMIEKLYLVSILKISSDSGAPWLPAPWYLCTLHR